MSLFVAVLVVILAEIHRIVPRIPVPPEAKIMYGSFLLLLLAQLVFSLFCPREVKTSKDAIEYVRTNQEAYERSQRPYKFEVVLAHLDEREPHMRELIERRLALEQRAREQRGLLGNGVAVNADPRLEELVDTWYPTAIQRHLVGQFQSAIQKNWPAILISMLLGTIGLLSASYLVIKRTILIFTS